MPELIMVFDTETTNKWNFQAPWNDAEQPDLVQLGYKVFTKDKQCVMEAGFLVDTTSWKTFNMSPEAQAVHGVTIENLSVYGSDPEEAAFIFLKWAERSFMRVAHNIQFDDMIISLFMNRAGFSPDSWKSSNRPFCTMKSTTDICKIPHPKGWNSYKWPSLQEAYTKLVDQKGFKGAHDALVDVNACADIFWTLVDRELIRLPLNTGEVTGVQG